MLQRMCWCVVRAWARFRKQSRFASRWCWCQFLSHQELNARAFAEAEAAIVLDRRDPGFVSRVEQAIARYLTDQAFAHLATGRLSHVLSVDQGEVLAEIVWDAARRHQGAV